MYNIFPCLLIVHPLVNVKYMYIAKGPCSMHVHVCIHLVCMYMYVYIHVVYRVYVLDAMSVSSLMYGL